MPRSRKTEMLVCMGLVVVCSLWAMRPLWKHPRLKYLDSCIYKNANLSDFKKITDEYQIPFEEDVNCGWGICQTVPLDGRFHGKRLRLHFNSEGGLQWAGIVNADGDVEMSLLDVD